MSDFDRSAGPPPSSGAAVFLQLGLGVVLVVLLHLAAACLLFGLATFAGTMPSGFRDAASAAALFWAMGLGIVQLAYVGPAALAMAFVRRPVALGMVIGAALTLVLQGACYGLVGLTLLGA